VNDAVSADLAEAWLPYSDSTNEFMKQEFVVLDDGMLDLEDWQCERSLQRAFLDAVYRARIVGTQVVVSDGEGRILALAPDQTVGAEQRALENIDRINRQIAEYLAHHPEEDSDRVRKSLTEPLYDADPKRYLRYL
jgi:hypothetical protein